ncbi:type II secretion system protein GspM [Tardiphaga robiniae]|uniref:General secretion pathway protein GspM n=1 Tax=Tardiphaga robiniae TaxID=943830 RepID=A0A7G6TUM8_9BRAD|nr:type II secretion system protein GspM [Tardiphaga robiniae]QND70460.1 hypothetical protein HB776_03780 [Tardiphaga robiniae]
MIRDQSTRALLLRRLRFVCINLAMLAVVALLVVAPLVSKAVEQGEAIADRADQLARLTAIAGNASPMRNNAFKIDEIYLSGSEERLASADLQANLKAVASAAGLRFLSVRAVTPGRPLGARMVAVGLDLEGSAGALRDAFKNIETARPILFVTSLVLRPAPGTADGVMRAELTVQGAMRDPTPVAANAGQVP